MSLIDHQIAMLRAGARHHWRDRIKDDGVRRAWRELVAETGDPVMALRHQARALEGACLGDRLDPGTWEAAGPAVASSRLSKVILGPPNVGKTTRAIIPGALQDLAGGARVVLVTPQPKTVADIYKSASQVGDRGVSILDLGGRIVSPDSELLTSWDPTRRCADPEEARAFAKTVAGPGSPVASDLGEGRGAGYWLQIPEGVTAAAAHLTAVERTMREQAARAGGLDAEAARATSLHPGGLNGIKRVFQYLRRPAPPDPERRGLEQLTRDLRSELTPAQRAALRDHPSHLKTMQDLVGQAAGCAARFDPRLQRLVYDCAIMELQGGPVDREVAGSELEELNEIMLDVARRDSNPLDQLGRAVRQAVPPNEQRILSPRPGDTEISPDDIARGPSGLTVVSYDSTGSPGLAAGWFCQEVLKAGFRESSALQAERLMGGTEEPRGITAWVDEGGALRHTDFDQALTEGRQHGIAVNISATSRDHLRNEVGEERAATILNSAPMTLNFAPTPDEARHVSDAFGTTKEEDETRSWKSDEPGWNTSVSQREVPALRVEQVLGLGPGEAVLSNSSDPDHRVSIVRTWAFHERDHPVGETMASVDAGDGPGMPWEKLRPDVHTRLEQRRAAEAAPRPPDTLRIPQPDDRAAGPPRPSGPGDL